MSGTTVKANDILLNITGASIGRTCIVPLDFKDGNVNQHVCIIRPNSKYSPKFIQSFLGSSRGQNLIQSTQVGGGREGLNFQSIRGFIIGFPGLKEQAKIASFLTAIDERINQLTKKHKLLEQYKKGVMQKIFSQEIRFNDDDGGEFQEWDRHVLEDIFKVTRGNVLSMTLVSQVKSESYPYSVYSSQTKNNGLAGYYNTYLFEDSITWTTDGANAGDVNYRSGKFYCTNVCGVLISTEGHANTCIAEIINLISRKYVSYVGNPKLMNNVMSKIAIDFPSVKEQTKIANFLSALDEKITNTKSQFEAMRQYKQGLLQQMFV